MLIIFTNIFYLSSNHATPHDLKIEPSHTTSVSLVYDCIEIIIFLGDDTQTLILETMNCEMELQKKKRKKNEQKVDPAGNRRSGR